MDLLLIGATGTAQRLVVGGPIREGLSLVGCRHGGRHVDNVLSPGQAVEASSNNPKVRGG